MSSSNEPTPLREALRAVHADVTVLVGDRRTEGAPTSEQLTLLHLLAGAFRVDTVAGAGAMLHEEAPTDVSRAITKLARRTVSGGEHGR